MASNIFTKEETAKRLRQQARELEREVDQERKERERRSVEWRQPQLRDYPFNKRTSQGERKRANKEERARQADGDKKDRTQPPAASNERLRHTSPSRPHNNPENYQRTSKEECIRRADGDKESRTPPPATPKEQHRPHQDRATTRQTEGRRAAMTDQRVRGTRAWHINGHHPTQGQRTDALNTRGRDRQQERRDNDKE